MASLKLQKLERAFVVLKQLQCKIFYSSSCEGYFTTVSYYILLNV